jgi:ribosomal protein S18 acetylase RimI-like enzyme
MDLTIRPANAQDYDDLCEIIAEVDEMHRQRCPQIFQRPPGPARERAYIEGLLADEDHGLFVAEVDGRVAGFLHVMAHDTPPIPILVPRRLVVVDNLVVRRDLRRAGIGRALMERAEQWAGQQGAAEIDLTVFEFNAGAIAFYRSLGYETRTRRMSKGLDQA